MSSPKEIHFYSYDSNHSLEWYLDHFKGSEAYKAVGEFSATYLHYPDVPKNIFETIGRVQIVVSLRNPVSRFISHYKHLYRLGDVKQEKLDISTYEEMKREHPELLERGNYSTFLKSYIEIFGINNVCILFKEKIDGAPHQVLQKLYDFLGVDQTFIPPILEKKVSPGIIPKVYFLETLRVKTYAFLKRRAPSLLNLIRKIRIAELYRKLNSKKEALEVTPLVLRELQGYYENEILELEQMLDIDLSSWKTNAPLDKVLS